MTDELTPERALNEWYETMSRDAEHAAVKRILAAWTRDRERLAVVTEERDTFAKAMELYRDDYYRVRAQRDALVPLAKLGKCAIEAAWHGTSMDGGDVQGVALRLGALNAVTVDGPCGGGCMCDEAGADWPTECYRIPQPVLAVLRAERTTTTEGGQGNG